MDFSDCIECKCKDKLSTLRLYFWSNLAESTDATFSH